MQDKDTTGFLMGKTINLILRKMVESPILQKFKREIITSIDSFLRYFDEMVNSIYQYYNSEVQDKDSVQIVLYKLILGWDKASWHYN